MPRFPARYEPDHSTEDVGGSSRFACFPQQTSVTKEKIHVLLTAADSILEDRPGVSINRVAVLGRSQLGDPFRIAGLRRKRRPLKQSSNLQPDVPLIPRGNWQRLANLFERGGILDTEFPSDQ